MKILITGASGFVGKNLVKRILNTKKDYQLTVTSTGSESLPKELNQSKNHKILYYSLEGIDWKHVYGQDVVVHLAANNDTRCQDESEMLRANLYGPISLFSKAAEGGCKNFVYASSTAVYGNSPAPYVENSTQESPLNHYGKSKKLFDNFAIKFAEEKNVKVIGLRYCNIYGPGEEHKNKRMSMIGQLIRNYIKCENPTLFKSGEQRRDWVYIEDVIDANMISILSDHSGIYNIGTGVATSFNELIHQINDIKTELVKRNFQSTIQYPNYIKCPFENEYQNYTCCNIEKAKLHLGYEPKYNLATGLKDYFEYLLKLNTINKA